MQPFSLVNDTVAALGKFISTTELATAIRSFMASFSSRWISLVWVTVAVIPPTFLIAEVASVYQEVLQQANPSQASPPIDRLVESLSTRLKEDSTLKEASGVQWQYPSGVTVRPGMKVTASRFDDRIVFRYETVPIYNPALIIVCTALWLVMLYSIQVLGSKKNAPATIDISVNAQNTNQSANIPTDESRAIVNANDGIGILRDEVLFARRRAAEIHQRSSVMLAAGVVMSFVGLAVYYVSLPAIGKDAKIETFLMEGLRPTAMLIFVEALAWFLLKQYRSLSDEYRHFHRLAQRRADFLVAFMSQGANRTAETDLFLLTALLQEPSSIILKQGESTESIESRRTDTSNPILEMADRVLQRIPIQGATKKDG